MKEISSRNVRNPLYNGINRKLSIIHAQFRMKFSNLKADLFQRHLVDDPMCICSNQIENCEHFFFHRSLYTTQRRDMLSQLRLLSNGLAITTDLLLFGS